MGTKDFDQAQAAALKTAKKQWEEDNHVLTRLRAEHSQAQEALAALRDEATRIEALIDSFENDENSAVLPDEFEEAVLRQRTLSVLVRRADGAAKQASEAWQDAERKRHSNARRARGDALTEFEKWSVVRRAEIVADYKPLL